MYCRAGWPFSVLIILGMISESLGAAHRDTFGNVLFSYLSRVEKKATETH